MQTVFIPGQGWKPDDRYRTVITDRLWRYDDRLRHVTTLAVIVDGLSVPDLIGGPAPTGPELWMLDTPSGAPVIDTIIADPDTSRNLVLHPKPCQAVGTRNACPCRI